MAASTMCCETERVKTEFVVETFGLGNRLEKMRERRSISSNNILGRCIWACGSARTDTSRKGREQVLEGRSRTQKPEMPVLRPVGSSNSQLDVNVWSSGKMSELPKSGHKGKGKLGEELSSQLRREPVNNGIERREEASTRGLKNVYWIQNMEVPVRTFWHHAGEGPLQWARE